MSTNGSVVQKGGEGASYGTIGKKANDLDKLFPERNQHRPPVAEQTGEQLDSPTFYADGAKDVTSETTSMASEVDDTAGLLKKGKIHPLQDV